MGCVEKMLAGYKAAKKDRDNDKMLKCANRIRKLQFELDITISEFPDIGIIGSDPDEVDLFCE